MKKALVFIIILFSIVLFSYFFKQQKQSQILDQAEQEKMSASQKLFTNATLTIPETTILVDFSSEVGSVAQYTDGEAEFAEHGTVTLFKDHVESVADEELVAFFAVDRGGSGTEIYLAVFTPGENSYQMKGSVFLGDRVEIDSLNVDDDDTITVAYREHGADQAMAEEPTTVVEKTFTYQELVESSQE